MKIIVNTRSLLKDRLDGIGWFTYETMKRITLNRPFDQFYFLFDRPFSEEFVFSNNIEPIVIGPPTRHPVLWYYWFEKQLPRLINRLNPDIFVSPDGYLSLKSQVKSLAVIHDINFLHFPKDLPFTSRWFYNHYFPLYAHKADRIATVSEYSKKDIVENYLIEPVKIDVLYNGYNSVYQPVADKIKLEIKSQYCDGFDYFIFIGSLLPRKNVANMLQAYEQFRKMSSHKIKFVIIGEHFFKTDDIRKTLAKMHFKNDVQFLGRLEPSEIRNLLASAIALLLVSKFEGFGIPVLEALRCETPVIVSDVASLPEVALDAAIYANPFSPESICDAMIKMLNKKGLREQLIENGKSVCQRYSWDKTSDLFWQSITKTIDTIEFNKIKAQ